MENRKISISKLQDIATQVKEFFSEKGISDIEGLEKFSNYRFQLGNRKPDFIEVFHSSEAKEGRPWFEVEYISPYFYGTPLDIRIHRKEGINFVNFILKAPAILPGYHQFQTDPFKNKIQYKLVLPSNWNSIEKELDSIISLRLEL